MTVAHCDVVAERVCKRRNNYGNNLGLVHSKLWQQFSLCHHPRVRFHAAFGAFPLKNCIIGSRNHWVNNVNFLFSTHIHIGRVVFLPSGLHYYVKGRVRSTSSFQAFMPPLMSPMNRSPFLSKPISLSFLVTNCESLPTLQTT
jgi:hypothetical protein